MFFLSFHDDVDPLRGPEPEVVPTRFAEWASSIVHDSTWQGHQSETPQPQSVGPFVRYPGLCAPGKKSLTSVWDKKKVGIHQPSPFIGSGGRTRTCDLRVMSPTSYHCSTPQCLTAAKIHFFQYHNKNFFRFFSTDFFLIFALSIRKRLFVLIYSKLTSFIH